MKRLSVITLLILFITSLVAAQKPAQPVQDVSNDPVQKRLERGLKSSEFYSFYLIDKAHSEPDRIHDHLTKAVRISPNLPAAYFHLAWVTITTSPANFIESLNYLLRGFSAYARNFFWSFNLIGIIFMGLSAAFAVTIAIVVIVRLPSDMPLISHEIKEENKKFFQILLLLFLSAFGPLYFIGAALMLISAYFRKNDLVISYAFFIALILLPILLKPVEMFISAELSPSLKAVVAVNEGKDNKYAIGVLSTAEEKPELFSYALALKREGRIGDAIAAYNKLLEKQPNDPRIYNNLGNCYAIAGQIENAIAMYEKANNIKPHVTAYYNLAQASRELLRFEDGDKFYDEARRLDAGAVTAFRENSSRIPNLYFIDELLGFGDFFRLALKSSGTRLFSLSLVPFWFTPLIGLIIMVSFVSLNKKRDNKAYRCKRCGAIICPKCDRSIKAGEMCQDCVASLVTLEKDPRDRIAKVMAVQDKKKSRKWVLFFLTLVMPGANLIYAGRILAGAIMTFFFITPLTLLVVSLFYRISIYPFTHSWLMFMVIAVTLLFYFINITMSRRFLKRWV
ncbi:MAG: tetratricopeptide repeat protein [Nitrospirota bacterium]|nr:MAG: tetratricopeptide repeat protein [Nitrospirota bacterium]